MCCILRFLWDPGQAWVSGILQGESGQLAAGDLQNSNIFWTLLCRILLTVLSPEVTELDPKVEKNLCQNQNGAAASYQFYQFVYVGV